MDDKLTIFIAVTAAAVVLQMLILAGMFFMLRKLSAGLEKTIHEVQVRLLPLLDEGKTLQAKLKSLYETNRPKIDQVVDNAAAVSSTARSQVQGFEGTLTEFNERARRQIIRADELVTHTLNRVEDTTAKVQHTVTSPIRHFSGILQGITVGLNSYFEKQRRGKNGTQRDEMFI